MLFVAALSCASPLLSDQLQYAVASQECMHAKQAVCCSNCTACSLQIFGGYGYLKEYKVERVWRDLRVHRLLEGTNEIMNVIISRELKKS